MKHWLFIRFRGLGLLAAGSGLWLLYDWRGGQSAQFLFYTCALVGVLMLLLAAMQNRHVQIERSSKLKHAVGERIEVQVTVTLAGKLPVCWLYIRDEWHDEWLFPGFKRRLYYTYSVENMPRGKYVSEQVICRREDPLGLFGMTKRVVSPLAFSVLPKPLPWNTNRLLQQATCDDEWSALRDYKEGDSLQRVHWKLSAKRAHWIVSDSARRFSSDWTVLLDGAAVSWDDASSDHSDDTSLAFERAVGLAVHFVRKVSSKGSCGVLCHGDQRIELPVRLAKETNEVIDMLATVQPNGHKSFAEVLHQEIPKLLVGSGVLCMTSQLTLSLALAIARLSSSGRYRIAMVICHRSHSSVSTAETSRAMQLLDRSGTLVMRAERMTNGGAAGA